ncbi:MAG: 30S ribosomal protein S4 [Candidatus Shapirobacteria bacterium]
MAREIAKCRLCRREGTKLYRKAGRCYTPKCPLERKGAVPPGQHGQRGQRRRSDYGVQLREKQKVKRTYGVLEKQLRRYFAKAAKQKGATGVALLRLLETRLDNMVYRSGLAPSRSVARQLVAHKHILINNQKTNIPSYQVKRGDLVTMDMEGLKMKEIKLALAEKDRKIPGWLARKAAVGKVVRLPEREEVAEEINESLIVEFYSR